MVSRPGDLTDPRWMYLKAALLLAIGITSSALILLELPNWRIAVLLALAIWSFARCYYFAFYVIERYIDPSYKFAGLGSALLFLLRQGR
jgi:hypothetical protein